MSAITPIRSITAKYDPSKDYGPDGYDTYIGRLAGGGFGYDRRKQFVADFKELVRLARIGEKMVAEGRFIP